MDGIYTTRMLHWSLKQLTPDSLGKWREIQLTIIWDCHVWPECPLYSKLTFYISLQVFKREGKATKKQRISTFCNCAGNMSTGRHFVYILHIVHFAVFTLFTLPIKGWNVRCSLLSVCMDTMHWGKFELQKSTSEWFTFCFLNWDFNDIPACHFTFHTSWKNSVRVQKISRGKSTVSNGRLQLSSNKKS